MTNNNTTLKVKIDGKEKTVAVCAVHASIVLDRATEGASIGNTEHDCEICTEEPEVTRAYLVRYFDRTDMFLLDGTFAGTVENETAYQDDSRSQIGRAAIQKWGGLQFGRNWADSKCTYGYITLCKDCYGVVSSANRRGDRFWAHIDTTKEIPGFPVHKCEVCKKQCIPPNNNAYQQNEGGN